MEATQESTQPCTDPRRIGRNNSGLLEEDVSDIICILHPTSLAAHDAVAATASLAPQHILQKDELEYENPDTAALDIALRLSSNVRNINLGFCFGRNRSRCDLLLAPDDSAKRISNTHFRIHLTGDGILMLEDLSTNGTVVDDCRLRKNQKENSRMLTNGSVIQVLRGNNASDEVRFVVRIPSRDGYAMRYTENMLRYLERVQKQPAGAMQKHRQDSVRPSLEWTVANAYGMHWTGGNMYNVTGQIGKGAFATVYKLATKQHGAVYAAKELDKRRFMKNGILDQKVDNEMKIMKDLKHVSFGTPSSNTGLLELITTEDSPTSCNTLITMNMTDGFILSWNMCLAASFLLIFQFMAKFLKTWSKHWPGSSCMHCNIFTNAGLRIVT